MVIPHDMNILTMEQGNQLSQISDRTIKVAELIVAKILIALIYSFLRGFL